MRTSTTCCTCKNPIEPHRVGNSAQCRLCSNEAMKRYRKKYNELTPDERKKANARSYVWMYAKEGKVKKLPCEHCGEAKVEAHHEDYSKPLEVIWLCKRCHVALHKSRGKYNYKNKLSKAS